MKGIMKRLRKEMAESGYFNRANTKYFKDKTKYCRKKLKNNDELESI